MHVRIKTTAKFGMRLLLSKIGYSQEPFNKPLAEHCNLTPAIEHDTSSIPKICHHIRMWFTTAGASAKIFKEFVTTHSNVMFL
jgi:hypothetical protein